MSSTVPPPTSLPRLYAEVWRHAHGARGRLLAALGLLGTSQLLKLALPWMAAQAIDAVQSSGRAGLLRAGLWIGAIALLYLGVWLLHGPARVLERNVALGVRRSVADTLYTQLAHAPLGWHDQHHSGDLHHRVTQASGALHGFTQSQFIYLQNALHLAGPLVALWLLSPLTGALAAAGVVTIAVLVLRFDRALMRLAAEENAAERRYSARLLDFVGNVSAVASLRLQRATRRLLDSRLQAVFAPLARSIVLTEWKWCAVDLLTVGLAWGLVVVYAGSTAGTLLIGSLFMVHQYAQQAGGVLCSMAANFQGLAHTQADHASAELIRQAPQQPVPAPVPAPWRVLDLQGLGFSHEGRARGGIHGVTLRLQRGERIALVGPSGSGKSTLLRVLAGLYAAQQGRMELDGHARSDVAALATLIPQEAEVFEATLRENLCFGEPVEAAALQRALRASALDEVVAGLPQGLDTPLSERGLNLSGGQRQRLALARGMLAARDSSLLLLDEPTSALDPVIEQQVLQGIGQAFGGACIVASIHRLSLLPHFDRVVLMAAGQVVDVGTAAELALRQPLFRALQLMGPAGPVREPGLPSAQPSRAVAGRIQERSPRMSPDIDRRSDDDEDDELSGEAAEGADAVALLAADHAEIKLLFAEYESLQADDAGDDAARGELARRICQALTIHAAAEEEIFYPAAREATGEDDMVDEAVDEHAAVKELILRIENMAPSDEFFDATLRTLREVVDEHVYDEEDELFPRVLESGLDLQALGDRIAECKEELQAAFEADEP